MIRKFVFFLFLVLFLADKSYSKSVLDVVSENKDLSIFYSYLQKTGLDRVLKKSFLGIGQFLRLVTRLLIAHQIYLKMKY